MNRRLCFDISMSLCCMLNTCVYYTSEKGEGGRDGGREES